MRDLGIAGVVRGQRRPPLLPVHRRVDAYQTSACAVGGITLAPHEVMIVPLPKNPMPMDIVLGYTAIRQSVWTITWAAVMPVGMTMRTLLDYPLNQWSTTRAGL